MSLTGSHVTAAKALQLGIVDQVTDQNTVEVAVKFALSIAGEARRRVKKKGFKLEPRFSLFLTSTEKERWNPYRAVIFGPVRHQDALTCRLCESDESEKNTRQADPPPPPRRL